MLTTNDERVEKSSTQTYSKYSLRLAFQVYSTKGNYESPLCSLKLENGRNVCISICVNMRNREDKVTRSITDWRANILSKSSFLLGDYCSHRKKQ